MLNIPSHSLTAEEIGNYWILAQATIAEWESVKTSTSAQEYTAYRERLSTASHGISTILDYLEKDLSGIKNRIGSVKLLLKDMERHSEMAKSRYWEHKE